MQKIGFRTSAHPRLELLDAVDGAFDRAGVVFQCQPGDHGVQQRYPVTAVDGRRPAGLDHCVGIRVLTVDRDGLRHRLFGRGVETSGVFRFHQQGLGSDGTVVMVWAISDSGDGTLVIEPAADR